MICRRGCLEPPLNSLNSQSQTLPIRVQFSAPRTVVLDLPDFALWGWAPSVLEVFQALGNVTLLLCGIVINQSHLDLRYGPWWLYVSMFETTD